MTAFVDQASNMFGSLSSSARARLERVIAKPNQRNWENAYSLIINNSPMITLWQAWVAVDEWAPRSKPLDGPWPVLPDQLTIYRAIRHATKTSQLES